MGAAAVFETAAETPPTVIHVSRPVFDLHRHGIGLAGNPARNVFVYGL